MQHCEAPIVDGRCPFDRDALPDPGPTPATHFALSTAPDAATALLLPFAEHPWHSRVVTALRQDAAIATTDDEPLFVLVSLPERLRPAVRDALTKLLDIRAHDRRAHSGISCFYPDEYHTVLNDAFPQDTRRVQLTKSSTDDSDSDADGGPTVEIKECRPEDVAAVCQLCRAGEFMQCFTVTDVACAWLGEWLCGFKSLSVHSGFLRLALQSLCDIDLGQPSRAVAEKFDPSSFTFARSPAIDSTFLSEMLSVDCSLDYIGSFPWTVPDSILDHIPPCALPHRVVATQLPCWPKTTTLADCCVDVFHGTRNVSSVEVDRGLAAFDILYVAKNTRVQKHTDAVLAFHTWELLQPFLSQEVGGVVLPQGIPDYPLVLRSSLLSRTRSITFPNDFRDEDWGDFDGNAWNSVEQLDLSQTLITTVPNGFFQLSELVSVNLPPTLRSIGPCAFSCCSELRVVCGLHRGVTIAPTAFASAFALPTSTFKDLPAAPRTCPTPPSAPSAGRKKRPRA